MACLSMVAAAVVEIIRLQVVADHNLQNTDPTAPGAPVVPMVRAAAAAAWCSSVCTCPALRLSVCVPHRTSGADVASRAGCHAASRFVGSARTIKFGASEASSAARPAPLQSVWWQIPQYMLVGECPA